MRANSGRRLADPNYTNADWWARFALAGTLVTALPARWESHVAAISLHANGRRHRASGSSRMRIARSKAIVSPAFTREASVVTGDQNHRQRVGGAELRGSAQAKGSDGRDPRSKSPTRAIRHGRPLEEPENDGRKPRVGKNAGIATRHTTPSNGECPLMCAAFSRQRASNAERAHSRMNDDPPDIWTCPECGNRLVSGPDGLPNSGYCSNCNELW